MSAPNNMWLADECVTHRNYQVEQFLHELLKENNRHVLYVAGAGFDPRCIQLAKVISETNVTRRALFIREERPKPQASLTKSADENTSTLSALFPNNQVEHINIFTEDRATIQGGALAAGLAASLELQDITDIIVDLSAMSIGVSFALTGTLFQRLMLLEPMVNLHVIAAMGSGKATEGEMVAESAEGIQWVKGFKPRKKRVPRVDLWLPQLTIGKESVLETIAKELECDEICPIIPFPARDPRAVENHLRAYQHLIKNSWDVDSRSFLYAAEDDPLDLYRSVSRIIRAREVVYEVDKGALTVVSPVGARGMAIGILMVAIEGRFAGGPEVAVAYCETLSYKEPVAGLHDLASPGPFIHVWLSGEVYER